MADFYEHGDDSGEIWREIRVLDKVWKRFIIAVDNAAE